MGIPKFFRYISERYPLISQLVEQNKIPEFDNLYLDFNGIIHNCSHPNDGDAHYRISEQEIFTSIFKYVDHLFGIVKPKKLFFLAIDGVAPRAKMNQQRSRRFRTAKEAIDVREKALAKGEKLPEEKAFDSNAITPGTPFMARLSLQLKYFIHKKISEDANWRDVQIILSGHEVPGEGEHKIMEYIRHAKAQPGYNPNVRHCMYGLDADLIMLGLLSHDPHFCLLREEVKFGPASKKRNTGGLDSQTFFLLHLSLMREYLDLEFHNIAATLPFAYNLERIIDDFITLAVFVGNDFLPHLPDLHINENALERLFDIYKRVLPDMGGYLNINGAIEMSRLQKIMDEMGGIEREAFEKDTSDTSWFKGKQRKHVETEKKKPTTGGLTTQQKKMFKRVEEWVLENRDAGPEEKRNARLPFVNDISAGERKFISALAAELHLNVAWDEYDEQDQNLIVLRLPTPPSAEEDDDDADDDAAWEDDDESRAAIDRVLKKYNQANVLDDEGFDDRYEMALQQKMDQWKDQYYKEKLEFTEPADVQQLVFRYCEGLQWVMYYYYCGVASWGWFYDYHYAPRISDLKGVEKLKFEFSLGRPFKPFEQLMGVLPEASNELVPKPYRWLMASPTSPIIEFYPQEFTQDMNGKKQEWEAIVKIPFIDEKRLLSAMAACESQLNDDERRRNSLGPSMSFKYHSQPQPPYESSLPGIFPDIKSNFCIMERYDLPTLDGLHLVQGLCDGVNLGKDALAGFPSLTTIRHQGMIGYHGVNVFNADSRNKSMILHLQNQQEGRTAEEMAHQLLNTKAFVGWPFLQEGLVIAVSTPQYKFTKSGKSIQTSHQSDSASHQWHRKAESLGQMYSKRFGVIVGDVELMVHAKPLKGLRRTDAGALVKDYADYEMDTAVQLVLTQVASEDPRFMEKEPPKLSEEFPEGTAVFFLGEHAYGVAARVQETTNTSLSIVLAFIPSEMNEPEKFKNVLGTRMQTRYYPSHVVADRLGISSHGISKLTSAFMVLSKDGSKTNIGLSLKFESKSLKVMDYTRKEGRGWEFSDKAMNLIHDYKQAFPEVFQRLNFKGDFPRAEDIFPGEDPEMRLREAKAWLSKKGVRDFEPVPLNCDQLNKETVEAIEKLADELTKNKDTNAFKKAIVKGIPREAVLLPAHAQYRLLTQSFSLGDRVTMVQESGGVHLAVKGVVVSLNANNMDVVWDVPFMGGTTLGNRCSQYRGSTVSFNSCLNLTRRQYVMSTNPNKPPQNTPRQTYMPAGQGASTPFGARTPISPRQQGAPAQASQTAPVRIMTNPRRAASPGQSAPSPTPPAGQHPAPRANRGRPAPPTNTQHDHILHDPAIVSVSDGPEVAPSPNRGRGRGRGGPANGANIVTIQTYNNPTPGRGRGDFAPRGGYRGEFRGEFRGGRGGGRGGRGGRGRGQQPSGDGSS